MLSTLGQVYNTSVNQPVVGEVRRLFIAAWTVPSCPGIDSRHGRHMARHAGVVRYLTVVDGVSLRQRVEDEDSDGQAEEREQERGDAASQHAH
ncbi:hypothetical protein J6590_043604 [Homalodisca vitripennis]|nr:hypothetical protein J6590_043604 [Homalodisca vitripennis]